MKQKIGKLMQKTLFGILASIVVGFIIGGIVLSIAGFNPFEAYGILLKGIFSKPRYLAQVAIKSTSVILCGLSFIVASKSGMFNIGAEGQYIAGSLAAIIVATQISLPPFIHFLAAVLAGIIASALLGMIISILKVKFQVHEVISSVMFNWIMLYFSNFLITLPWLKKVGTEATVEAQESAWSVIAQKWKSSPQGFDTLANSASPFADTLLKTDLNYGILLAVLIAIAIAFFYQNTTKGFELRAVGNNPNASRLAKINVNRITIEAMALSAALAGLAGALTITGTMPHRVSQLATHEGYGFAGISVALIGGGSPIGSIFSGVFFSMLNYGGASMQSELGAPSEIIDVIIGIIIYIIAILPFMIKKLSQLSFWNEEKRSSR